MPSYLVTGASRGIGYAFILELASNSENTVIGLVRNKEAVEKQIQADGVKNVHIVQADITDFKSLQTAKAEVEKITPVIDYLINNAGAVTGDSAWLSLSDFENNPDVLERELMVTFRTNVLGTINVINTFLPLVKQSSTKKVISVSSGLADIEFTNKHGLWESAPYSISKTALNMTVAKYNARHQKDGILFLAISPGFVGTGNEAQVDVPADAEMGMKFAAAYPHFQGPITPEESVKSMMQVIDKATASNEYAGDFVSHLGNKQWL